MKLTFLGTGTSYGVPFVACDCAVCRSDNPRNKRLRSSILLQGENAEAAPLLVDTTPDLRAQMLRENIKQLSAVLWTHAHNDHIIGLDDLRPLTDRSGYIPGYADAMTAEHLRRIFAYAFEGHREHGGFPRIELEAVPPYEPIAIGDIEATPLPIQHGLRTIYAYRFRSGGKTLVYATDCSFIPDQSRELMCGADVLVLDALRYNPHPAHFSVEQALHEVEDLQPGRTFFTHIAHDLDHDVDNAKLPSGVEIAYDGLTFEW